MKGFYTILLLIVSNVFMTFAWLLVGYYIAALAFYFALKNDANMFRVGWALCLPLISIILNILAVRAIGRDEVMVKAADRLR